MNSWGRAFGYGFLVWLAPFVIAFAIFPLHEPARPLFESIMAVAVTVASVVCGVIYMKPVTRRYVVEGICLGLIWFLMAIAIDAPLMLLGGPMKMSFGQYMADIGVTYLCIPAVTVGIGMASSSRAIGSAPDGS